MVGNILEGGLMVNSMEEVCILLLEGKKEKESGKKVKESVG